MSVTVAVTGPTGDIGRALMRALERSREVTAIRAMARRELDPAAEGWRKTTYLRGDVLDRDAVDELVAGADAVVHLAFAIMGAGGRDGPPREPRGLAQRVRGDGRGRACRGSSTPRRSPPTASTRTTRPC